MKRNHIFQIQIGINYKCCIELIFLTAIVLIFAVQPAYSFENVDIIKKEFYFEEPVLEKGIGGYDLVKVPSLWVYGNPGIPVLPYKTIKLLLPPNSEVTYLNASINQEIMINGTYSIEPGQDPVPLSIKNNANFTPPNESIYNSDNPYPKDIYEIISVQKVNGYSILILNIYPVKYYPKSGIISYFPEIIITINTSEVKTLPIDANENFRGSAKDGKRIVDMVDNPETLKKYPEEPMKPLNTTSLPTASYDYVIITNNALSNHFGELAYWKTKRGVNTQVMTVEDISTIYSGADLQEKIRKFIKDAYNYWGITYVLLGGDTDIIPHRGFYVEMGSYTDYDIPSDLYYAALDGTWNQDSDSLWGEPGEEDLFAEVFVGRAPVGSSQEAYNFISKTITYESLSGYEPHLKKALMVGEKLDPYQWGGDYKDEIKTYLTPPWMTSTLYDRDYPGNYWPKSEIISRIDQGQHLINHMGHSNINYGLRMSNSDTNYLTNNNYSLIYTQGCYSGAFDKNDSIAEAFVVGEHGAFAMIANSRYGWYSSVSTGPSQYFDREFFDAIFKENIRSVGRALQDSKEDNAGLVSDRFMRYVYYEINLIGDPQTVIHEPLPDRVHNINKGTNYTTIQAAVNDASPGDEIHVDNGTYFETVNVNKRLTLRGIDMPVVDAGGSGNAITLSVDGITLEGFTATGAPGFYSGEGGYKAGIMVLSNNNMLIDNNVNSNTDMGILLEYSSNNTLISNNVSNSGSGIHVGYSSNNNTLRGNIASNGDAGIEIVDSNNNTLIDNDASNNKITGIWLSQSNSNMLSGNIAASNNRSGIDLSNSSKNTLIGNIAVSNKYSNIEVGTYSNNNTLIGNNALNSWYGIYLRYYINNNMLNGNNVSNNLFGIYLNAYSNNNMINGNNVSNNIQGIHLSHSINNKIYHNNFINNTNQAFDDSTNAWDSGYPQGGNYWSDYIGVDLKSGPNQNTPGSDGIGDTPYTISGGGAQDRYPLIGIDNIIKNPGFESGTTSWNFYTNGAGTFMASSPGFGGGGNAAKLVLKSISSNMQLYQAGVTLEPNTRYRVSFAAYSTTGHDVNVNLIKNIAPYSNYGLNRNFDLGTSWQTFMTEFSTSGFTGTVSDGRLRFWLPGFAAAGDIYYIDDVKLDKVSVSGPVHNINKGSDYTTIQAAINDASPGSEIHVDSGTYYENVNVSKRLLLKGVDNGGGKPVVNGSGGVAITLSAGWSTLEGFTAISPITGGILVVSNNNIIKNNTASYNTGDIHYTNTPPGIWLVSSSNNILIDNIASNNWHGILLVNSSNNTLIGNIVDSNIYEGIYLAGSSDNRLSDNTASNSLDPSYTSTPSGIVLDFSSNNTLSNNKIYNNHDGIGLSYSSNNNKIFNNYFNNIINNFNFYSSGAANSWNITKKVGTNIIGGPYLGGNFWANPSGTGFSQTCPDNNKDGLCDIQYTLNENNSDYLPLAAAQKGNLIINPGFESGKSPWMFYTSGTGTFGIISPGYEGNNAAKLAFTNGGANVQLYQIKVPLEANTLYRLSFAAYSNTGHDMTVKLFKNVSPFTSYMPDYTPKLSTGWQTFNTEFTTTGFTGTINDGRLMFWFAPFVKPGDRYYIDDIRLEKPVPLTAQP